MIGKLKSCAIMPNLRIQILQLIYCRSTVEIAANAILFLMNLGSRRLILLLLILLCRRLLSHFQDVCYVPVATSTPMQAKQSVQKCYEGTVSKDQDENAAEDEDEDEATSAPLQAKQCLQFPELYKESVTVSKMTDETLSALEDDETLSASEDEDEDIGIITELLEISPTYQWKMKYFIQMLMVQMMMVSQLQVLTMFHTFQT
ncbi:uncharacterized protein [Ptychodera flava]|uniref:uncharacterized protein n=1 Tax=Ptychodera flava TaxID=63121 RepID=UPI00396A12AB